MGFYSETQTLDQQVRIKDNLQCSTKPESSFVDGKANNNYTNLSPPPPPPLTPMSTQSNAQISKLEASTTSTSSSVFASFKALFTSNTVDKSRCNSFESKPSLSRPSTPKHDQSSGYHSLENSLDMDDSYIKVCKFTGKLQYLYIRVLFWFS